MLRRPESWLVALLPLAIGLSATLPVRAQSTIKQPGQRPHYYFEAEPHLLVGLFDPPGFGDDTGLGVGFRGSLDIVKDGFIPKLNDSIGIGFGLDYLRYDGWQGPRGRCEEFVSGPSGTPVCVRVSGGFDGDVDYFYVPVVMQWNFWLHRRWSVFGEPGAALYVEDGDVDFQPFVLYAGGRFHITDYIALTLRLGYPTFSFGVSFLL
jgi:hypothetical protein